MGARATKRDRIAAGEILCARPECENPAPHSYRKYCSHACASAAMRRPLAVCPVCRKEMTWKQSTSKQQTCSRRCSYELPRSRGEHDQVFRDRLYQLWEVDGKTGPEIARELHITKNAVAGMVRRMGLSKRPVGRWPEGYEASTTRAISKVKVAKYSNSSLKSQSGETKRQLSDVMTVSEHRKRVKTYRHSVPDYRAKLREKRSNALTAPHVNHPVSAKVEAAKAKQVSPIRVVDLPGDGCQYPISENPWTICDAPRVPYEGGRPGLSAYCCDHFQLCWNKVPQKRLAAA